MLNESCENLVVKPVGRWLSLGGSTMVNRAICVGHVYLFVGFGVFVIGFVIVCGRRCVCFCLWSCFYFCSCPCLTTPPFFYPYP